jgi:hypothetical protein
VDHMTHEGAATGAGQRVKTVRTRKGDPQGTVGLIFAVSLTGGLRQAKRRRGEPATVEYTGFGL